MEPRDDENREPQMALEPRQEEPKPRRFRIVKLEERIAPQATGYMTEATKQPRYCIKSG